MSYTYAHYDRTRKVVSNPKVRVLMELHPPGWLRWWQRPWLGVRRLAHRLVRYLWRAVSDEYAETITCMTERTVNCDSIRELICQSKDNMDLIWHKEAKHVIVGPYENNDLQRECEDAAPYSFPLALSLGQNGQQEVFGLTVHVIPWFDGCVVLPDLESKAMRKQNSMAGI